MLIRILIGSLKIIYVINIQVVQRPHLENKNFWAPPKMVSIHILYQLQIAPVAETFIMVCMEDPQSVPRLPEENKKIQKLRFKVLKSQNQCRFYPRKIIWCKINLKYWI